MHFMTSKSLNASLKILQLSLLSFLFFFFFFLFCSHWSKLSQSHLLLCINNVLWFECYFLVYIEKSKWDDNDFSIRTSFFLFSQFVINLIHEYNDFGKWPTYQLNFCNKLNGSNNTWIMILFSFNSPFNLNVLINLKLKNDFLALFMMVMLLGFIFPTGWCGGDLWCEKLGESWALWSIMA